MRMQLATLVAIALAAVACSSTSGPEAPAGGGPVGAVTVGSGIQFVSRHNGTVNPAVDTVLVGETVTWSWSGNLAHSVRSTGTPSFTNSDIRTGGSTYSVTFTEPGTYTYDCVVHGQAMTGRVVVLEEAP